MFPGDSQEEGLVQGGSRSAQVAFFDVGRKVGLTIVGVLDHGVVTNGMDFDYLTPSVPSWFGSEDVEVGACGSWVCEHVGFPGVGEKEERAGGGPTTRPSGPCPPGSL